jgi:hypothetical protein
MGNNNSALSENNIEYETQQYNIGIFDLFENINKHCLALSDKYKHLLLSTKDNKSLAIFLENSLKKLPLAKLKNLNTKLSYNVYIKKNTNKKLNVSTLKITKELQDLAEKIEKGNIDITLKNVHLTKYHYLLKKKHHKNKKYVNKHNRKKKNTFRNIKYKRKNHKMKGGDITNDENYNPNEYNENENINNYESSDSESDEENEDNYETDESDENEDNDEDNDGENDEENDEENENVKTFNDIFSETDDNNNNNNNTANTNNINNINNNNNNTANTNNNNTANTNNNQQYKRSQKNKQHRKHNNQKHREANRNRQDRNQRHRNQRHRNEKHKEPNREHSRRNEEHRNQEHSRRNEEHRNQEHRNEEHRNEEHKGSKRNQQRKNKEHEKPQDNQQSRNQEHRNHNKTKDDTEVITNNSFFRNCSSNSNHCLMNKNEICKALAWHLSVKMNIISAILLTIPKYNLETKKIIHHSFCSLRLFNIENSKFCIPKHLRNSKLPPKQLLEELIKYIHRNEASCDDYWVLNNDNKARIHTSKSKLSEMYLERAKKLQNTYNSKLHELLNILKILTDEELFDNEQLYQIASQTKELLDDLYRTCETEYVLLILTLIYNNSSNNESLSPEIKKEIFEFIKLNT